MSSHGPYTAHTIRTQNQWSASGIVKGNLHQMNDVTRELLRHDFYQTVAGSNIHKNTGFDGQAETRYKQRSHTVNNININKINAINTIRV